MQIHGLRDFEMDSMAGKKAQGLKPKSLLTFERPD